MQKEIETEKKRKILSLKTAEEEEHWTPMIRRRSHISSCKFNYNSNNSNSPFSNNLNIWRLQYANRENDIKMKFDIAYIMVEAVRLANTWKCYPHYNVVVRSQVLDKI